MLTNPVLDEKFINELVAMKRYYRNPNKINDLIAEADRRVDESDYSHIWDLNRRDMIKYLRQFFQLDEKSASYIKFTNITDDTNNASYSFQIEIGKSPIEPKYAIGTEDELTV